LKIEKIIEGVGIILPVALIRSHSMFGLAVICPVKKPQSNASLRLLGDLIDRVMVQRKTKWDTCLRLKQ